MKNPASENPALQAHQPAQPTEADHQIYVTIEDYGPITLHELIEANAQPGVTPITHFTATAIRNLPIGGIWEDFGDAAITRVEKP